MKIYYTHSFNNMKNSHQLLERAIGKYQDCEPGELMAGMRTGELGKPYIDGLDDFSISHSENSWAVLFNEGECGLDIQHHKKLDYMPIAERWYHRDEVRRIAECRAESEEKALNEFFRIWTRREALVKAMGRSIADSGLPSTLSESVSAGGRSWRIVDLDIPWSDNLSAAMCAEFPEDVEWIDLAEE